MAYVGYGNLDGKGHRIAYGTFTLPSTEVTLKITLGFKPKYLTVLGWSGSNSAHSWTYIEDASTTGYTTFNRNAGTAGAESTTLPNTTANRLSSIDDDGFTVKGTTNNVYYNLNHYYFAIE